MALIAGLNLVWISALVWIVWIMHLIIPRYYVMHFEEEFYFIGKWYTYQSDLV